MRILYLLLLALISFHRVAAQEESFTDFRKLEAVLDTWPDTVQLNKLRSFSDEMIEAGRFDDAQTALHKALDIAQQKGDEVQLGRTYITLGYLERNRANHSQAIIHFQKALDLFTQVRDYGRMCRALQHIGTAYFQIRELHLAEQYYLRALKLSREHKLLVETADIYGELASVEDIRKNFNKALEYNANAIAVCREQKVDYVSLLFNRAIILKNAGQYAKSEQLYQQCLRIADEKKLDYLRGYVYMNLPNTLLLLNRPDEAAHYAHLALKWAAHSSQPVLHRLEVYDVLTRIYEQQGNFKQALVYQRQWSAFRDSLLNKEKSQQLVEAETRYQAREREKHIGELNEDNARRTRQLWWLGAGLTGVIILLGLSLWQYRIIQDKNTLLAETNRTVSEQNKQISEQSTQLKNLMRELHHRVKNNLAVISSLLRLQSNRLEDEGAVRAVREGQQRVEAMALIHQRLYQTDNVTRVNLKEYITDLAEGLMYAYGFSPERLKLNLAVESVEVDVEKAVPLGLALNELLTNAFKHAFEHVPHPELCIRLRKSEGSAELGLSSANLILEVKDNGPGIDLERWQEPGGTFGKRLIVSLSEQAGGHFEIRNHEGTCTRLEVPLTN